MVTKRFLATISAAIVMMTGTTLHAQMKPAPAPLKDCPDVTASFVADFPSPAKQIAEKALKLCLSSVQPIKKALEATDRTHANLANAVDSGADLKKLQEVRDANMDAALDAIRLMGPVIHAENELITAIRNWEKEAQAKGERLPSEALAIGVIWMNTSTQTMMRMNSTLDGKLIDKADAAIKERREAENQKK